MLKYIVRRLLVALPTLFAILLLSFALSRMMPYDPIQAEVFAEFSESRDVTPEARARAYRDLSHARGLDLPMFYFGLSSLAETDTLHRILELGDRTVLTEIVAHYGNWPQVEAYHHAVVGCIWHLQHQVWPSALKPDGQMLQRTVEELRVVATTAEVEFMLHSLDSMVQVMPGMDSVAGPQIAAIGDSWDHVVAQAQPWRTYVPSFHWYGFDNQFHRWLGALLRLDLGRSYTLRRDILGIIGDSMPWTIFMGLFSYVIAYGIAIPVGVYGVRKRGRWQDDALTTGLFMLHSVPTFVAALLAMLFLCNPDSLQLFPTSGIASDGSEQWPIGYRIVDHAYHLVLPTLLFSYHSITYISRQLRAGLGQAMDGDYIRTARAKGLSEKTVVWRHALRNSLLPIITHLAHLIPALVGGAFVVEYIFSVPGMGLITLNALMARDHQVIVDVFAISAVATLAGTLLMDILYAWADPRINYATQ